MMGLLLRSIAATVMMAALLAGCSAGPVGDTLPNSLGGLPQGAPARPNVVNRQYPAVHDMPAARATEPLSETDQVKLEKELQAARDRQEAEAKDAAPPAPPPAPPPAAAKPAAKKQGDASASGAKTSGAKTNP